MEIGLQSRDSLAGPAQNFLTGARLHAATEASAFDGDSKKDIC